MHPGDWQLSLDVEVAPRLVCTKLLSGVRGARRTAVPLSRLWDRRVEMVYETERDTVCGASVTHSHELRGQE